MREEDREREHTSHFTQGIYHQNLSQLEIITIIIKHITRDWSMVQPASELLPLISRLIFTVSVPWIFSTRTENALMSSEASWLMTRVLV